jgi:hypothetical protein
MAKLEKNRLGRIEIRDAEGFFTGADLPLEEFIRVRRAPIRGRWQFVLGRRLTAGSFGGGHGRESRKEGSVGKEGQIRNTSFRL